MLRSKHHKRTKLYTIVNFKSIVGKLLDESHAAWQEWTFLSAHGANGIFLDICYSTTLSLMITLTIILFRHVVYYDDVGLTDYL